MAILNTPADLAALKGTPDYATALQILLGSTQTWINQAAAGAAPDWQLVSVLSTIQAMGFMTVDDLLAECAAAGVVAPPAPAQPAPPPPAPPITVQMWQAKAVLKATAFAPSQAQSAIQAVVANATNLLDAANALIAASGNGALQAFWEYATALQSDNAMIASLGAEFGLSSAQIAALFAAAAALSF
jgi:hypothetical protein